MSQKLSMTNIIKRLICLSSKDFVFGQEKKDCRTQEITITTMRKINDEKCVVIDAKTTLHY
jgi:hypothetical protein